MFESTFFHIMFVVTFLTFFGVRAFYQRKAQLAQGKIEYKEGKVHVGLRLLIGIPFMLIFFAYIINPDVLIWAQFSLPSWAQWLGVVLGLFSLPLIVWIQWALDVNFSTTLHVREEHTLITRGPYRWVRHPMYTTLYIYLIGVLLMTSNWLIGGLQLIALSLIVVTRIRNEEATMIEKFGDRYRDYIRQTGRFLPRRGGI